MGELKLYFPDLVFSQTENWLYPTLSLFAEIGGYVGLLLGYSAMHIVDYIGGLLDRRIDHIDRKKKGLDKKLDLQPNSIFQLAA